MIIRKFICYSLVIYKSEVIRFVREAGEDNRVPFRSQHFVSAVQHAPPCCSKVAISLCGINFAGTPLSTSRTAADKVKRCLNRLSSSLLLNEGGQVSALTAEVGVSQPSSVKMARCSRGVIITIHKQVIRNVVNDRASDLSHSC